jgi:guanine deaminase
MEWHQSLTLGEDGLQTIEQAAHLLFGIMTVSDDRAVDETWVLGKRAYKKA